MMKRLLLLLVFLTLLLNFAHAQYTSKSKRAVKRFKAALVEFERRHYPEALDKVTSALKIDYEFIEAHLLQAQIFMEKGNTRGAISAFRNATRINANFFPMALYSLGNLEIMVGEYTEARKHFLALQKQPKTPQEYRQKILNAINSCDFAIQAIANPVPFEPENMGTNVNSKNNEYLPSLTLDEQTLILTVCVGRKKGGCQEDFYICTKDDDGEWTKAKNIGAPLNTSGNEGAQAISADGLFLFSTACNRNGGLGRCDIYASRKMGRKWTSPQNLGYPVNTKHWESQPSFSSDGKTLYFTSNNPRGHGRKDIWCSELQGNGSWSVPTNLGNAINTSGDDMSPFIHPDNQTLYFASDGHAGMGGLDIFYSRKDSVGNWQTPINLGYPINTNGEESSLILNGNGNMAYFASNRLEGSGGLDIYNFVLYIEARPKPVTYVKGKVFDITTKKRLGAFFELIDLETSKTVIESSSNDISGEFLVALPTDRNYALNVTRNGYLFFSENFSLKGNHLANKPYLLDVPLQPVIEGKKIILKNIFFETALYELKPESNVELNKLVAFLNKNARINIEIGGHTDNVGSAESNQTLSENRAKSVYEYLLAQKIPASRISFKGYGETQPLTTNDTEKGRATNRRTECKILK